MLCPASCLPLLRELAQWRCLLGWHRHHGVSSTSAAGLTANTGQQQQQQQQQGSEVRDRASRPVGRTKPLSSSQPAALCRKLLLRSDLQQMNISSDKQ
ncbi:E3 ubiquitin-protein ligase Siah2 isoform X2 [Lates japonicus]|uniref:E3 ubiquitin-protein ligase Siah2 isoform X2 n=1 Tax=Lates japonicus TaxID=270547 RepID=A0AAD3NGT3_LATJO|nr:E3 ubiquitin-protein ligase Siah2 isoform X2 [Lates japonicus]